MVCLTFSLTDGKALAAFESSPVFCCVAPVNVVRDLLATGPSSAVQVSADSSLTVADGRASVAALCVDATLSLAVDGARFLFNPADQKSDYLQKLNIPISAVILNKNVL